MSSPSELSLAEVRLFMLNNNCKVTNHALVSHFKRFLTNPASQNEARKQFKTYVNTLATIKNEGTDKFLCLRKKYLHDCPSEDSLSVASMPTSPDSRSLISDGESCASPFRTPPPYRPPPIVTPPVTVAVPLPVLTQQTKDQYQECVDEFESAVAALHPPVLERRDLQRSYGHESPPPPAVPPRKRTSVERLSRESSVEQPCEVAATARHTDDADKENVAVDEAADTKMTVKEATKKFNRIASIEEPKIPSPIGKKKPEKGVEESAVTMNAENLLSHAKAKEWLVSAARANYQELCKIAGDHPQLVKLHDPTTGTALHWAAKHGSGDVVKLIAGTYQADVNARTNGGYTPLHIAMQFGRDNIFELLCNVYKADRDLMDWSGSKALDYRKQKTSVSASTYSKIKARKKHSEKDLGFLRIGSLNVRVKKTTEAFSNFLGVGSSHQSSSSSSRVPTMSSTAAATHHRATAPPTFFEGKMPKPWSSADSITREPFAMPPPKYGPSKKRRSKRGATPSTTATAAAADFFGGTLGSGYRSGQQQSHSHSMPTTPSQTRAAPIGIVSEHPESSVGDSDSDSACGFDNNWHGGHAAKAKDTATGKARPTYI